MNNKVIRAGILKLFMPILAVAYGVAIIYLTALPIAGDNPGLAGEMLTWLFTLAGIVLTLFLVHRVEPKVFPDAEHFSLKLPKASVSVGLLLLAPLWLVAEEYMVYGISSLSFQIQMEPLTYTAAELREDHGSRYKMALYVADSQTSYKVFFFLCSIFGHFRSPFSGYGQS